MANLAQRVNVNLWTYTASSGGSILKAIHYLAPYTNPKLPWPGSDDATPLTQSARNVLSGELLDAQSVYGGFTKAIDLLPSGAVSTDKMNLFVDA